MELISDAMGGFGAVLLPMAAALLFEELTFGGLVRLLVTHRSKPRGGEADVLKRYNPRSKTCAERRGP